MSASNDDSQKPKTKATMAEIAEDKDEQDALHRLSEILKGGKLFTFHESDCNLAIPTCC
ncbi:hypothetical protein NQZ68_036924 [Dissostichus eleginoides]|nr:hypothetical protein NQZ68_036924 [Dissostichus eleginoides]